MNKFFTYYKSDGTTDVTRTTIFSNPSKEMKEIYTLILKGNIDLERIVFPKNSNISGSNLDVIARKNLWKVILLKKKI